MRKQLKSLNIKFVQNDHKIIAPKELDFYFPYNNFAIEFNGDYWHCNPLFYAPKDIGRQNLTAEKIWAKDKWKYDNCQRKNIYLLQIWEHDWNARKEIIKSKIVGFLMDK